MSTNVLQNQVRAIKTLIVPTVKVLTAAHANRDLLEMGLFVKVTRRILVLIKILGFGSSLIKHFFSPLRQILTSVPHY